MPRAAGWGGWEAQFLKVFYIRLIKCEVDFGCRDLNLMFNYVLNLNILCPL